MNDLILFKTTNQAKASDHRKLHKMDAVDNDGENQLPPVAASKSTTDAVNQYLHYFHKLGVGYSKDLDFIIRETEICVMWLKKIAPNFFEVKLPEFIDRACRRLASFNTSEPAEAKKFRDCHEKFIALIRKFADEPPREEVDFDRIEAPPKRMRYDVKMVQVDSHNQYMRQPDKLSQPILGFNNPTSADYRVCPANKALFGTYQKLNLPDWKEIVRRHPGTVFTGAGHIPDELAEKVKEEFELGVMLSLACEELANLEGNDEYNEEDGDEEEGDEEDEDEEDEDEEEEEETELPLLL